MRVRANSFFIQWFNTGSGSLIVFFSVASLFAKLCILQYHVFRDFDVLSSSFTLLDQVQGWKNVSL